MINQFSVSTLIALTIVVWSSAIGSFVLIDNNSGVGLAMTLMVVGVWFPVSLVIRDILNSGRIEMDRRSDWVWFAVCTGQLGITVYTIRAFRQGDS